MMFGSFNILKFGSQNCEFKVLVFDPTLLPNSGSNCKKPVSANSLGLGLSCMAFAGFVYSAPIDALIVLEPSQGSGNTSHRASLLLLHELR